MNRQNSHIILRQVVEIQSTVPQHDLGLQDRIKEVAYTRLLPKMEALFNEYADQDHYMRFEALEIDAGTLKAGQWEEELEQKILRQLELILRQTQKTPISKTDGEEKENGAQGEVKEKVWFSFLYFLENGTLPWYANYPSIIQMEKELLGWREARRDDNDWIKQLKPILKENPVALKRLCTQYSDKWNKELVSGFLEPSGDFSAFINDLPVILTSLQPQIYNEEARELSWTIVWENVLDIPSSTSKIKGTDEVRLADMLARFKKRAFQENHAREREETNDSPHSELLDQPIFKPALSKIDFKENKKKLQKEYPEKEKTPGAKRQPFYFIENAGLVLLHPFLSEFFQKVELLKKKNFKSKSAQQRALMLAQYLVTGEEDMAEFKLMLNKVLCNYPLEEPVSRSIKLKKAEQLQVTSLLETVIDHWKMHGTLVNTSIDGLRASFLQRPGKLSKTPKGWLLQVEQRSYDIVLNHLPWGIGMIQLPWMEEMLTVEWNG